MPGSDKYIRYQRSMLFSRVIPLSWNPVMLPNRLPLLTPRSGIFGAILPRLVLLNRSMSLETEESIIMEDSMLFIFSARSISFCFSCYFLLAFNMAMWSSFITESSPIFYFFSSFLSTSISLRFSKMFF